MKSFLTLAAFLALVVSANADEKLNWNMTNLESRVSQNEKNLDQLEKLIVEQGKALERLESRINLLGETQVKAECPCPEGPCTCGDDCDCPNCPKHSKKVAKDVVTGEGKEILFFTATWCDPCKRAKAKAGDLLENPLVKLVDFDKRKDLVSRYSVGSIPTAILTVDGKLKSRAVGAENAGSRAVLSEWVGLPTESVSASSRVSVAPRGRKTVAKLARGWWSIYPGDLRNHILGHAGYRGEDLSGLSQSELIQVHSNLHEAGRTGINYSGATTSYSSYSQPTVRYVQPSYQPRVYFRQSSGYCPTCR